MAGNTEILVLVRHALAGAKLADPVRDAVRGLDAAGRATAEMLPEAVLDHVFPSVLVSSPLARCRQTLMPLARATGLPVRSHDGLLPTAASATVTGLLRSVEGSAVVCTHGEVFTCLFPDLDCVKGAFWIVERDGGVLTPVRYVPPPEHPAAGRRDDHVLVAGPRRSG